MANPSGTVYLQANTGYVWTDGDVYQIPQTDLVEGAATGASFNGLGVLNQPHQVLLNKVNLLRAQQLTDQANITALQNFQGAFVTSKAVNGYQTIANNQVTPSVVMQWGTISVIGMSGLQLKNVVFTFNLPFAFPNAIWALMPYWQSNAVTGVLALNQGVLVLEAITPLQLFTNRIAVDWNDQQEVGSSLPQINVAQTPTDGRGLTGIGYLAIGY